MIAAGELHVVNVKAVQPFGHRFQMHRVVDEAEVVFDLGVADVFNRRLVLPSALYQALMAERGSG